MQDMVKVRVATPVKIDTDLFMAGEQEVGVAIANILRDGGFLEADDADADEASTEAAAAEPAAMTSDQIDELVAARAKAIAETIVDAVVNDAVTSLVAERDAAIARANEAEARLAAAEADKAKGAADPVPAAAPVVGTSKKSAATKG